MAETPTCGQCGLPSNLPPSCHTWSQERPRPPKSRRVWWERIRPVRRGTYCRCSLPWKQDFIGGMGVKMRWAILKLPPKRQLIDGISTVHQWDIGKVRTSCVQCQCTLTQLLQLAVHCAASCVCPMIKIETTRRYHKFFPSERILACQSLVSARVSPKWMNHLYKAIWFNVSTIAMMPLTP